MIVKATPVELTAPVTTGLTSIELRRVSKLFPTSRGDAWAGIRETDLTVKAQEFVCIIGPSGCGKSTILNLVAGLYAPDSGKILINGVPLQQAKAQAKVGYMLARDSLLPWRSALGNVELAMEMA